MLKIRISPIGPIEYRYKCPTCKSLLAFQCSEGAIQNMPGEELWTDEGEILFFERALAREGFYPEFDPDRFPEWFDYSLLTGTCGKCGANYFGAKIALLRHSKGSVEKKSIRDFRNLSRGAPQTPALALKSSGSAAWPVSVTKIGGSIMYEHVFGPFANQEEYRLDSIPGSPFSYYTFTTKNWRWLSAYICSFWPELVEVVAVGMEQ